MQIKQPQLQIARNYTILPAAEKDGKKELTFLIRKERNGEVSGYLHRLPVGADIEVRGPVIDYVLPSDVQSVVFLAGGTGIAPAMQVAEALAGKADVRILWANRRREDCGGGISDTPPPQGWTASIRGWFVNSAPSEIAHDIPASQKNRVVQDLEGLKAQHSSFKGISSQDIPLKTDYFVDEEGTFINPARFQRLLHDAPSAPEQSAGRKLLLVSGPDGFIKAWAGSKQWVDGREVQGPLGGVLSTLDTTGWDVVKL